MTLTPTPGQTVGPFFAGALPYPGDHLLVPRDHPRAITLSGRVLDGAGAPVPDALVELWQADEEGAVPQVQGSLRRDPQSFTGWGRAATNAAGEFSFTTLRPGGSFFAITVVARGLLNRLFTRAYLPGCDERAEPLLASLPEDRRATLISRATPEGFGFDVVLQGPDETVFLTFPGHARD